MTVQELFTEGWQHHQADRYAQAEAAFRQVVQADPSHTAAWALLAETCLLQGKFAEAEGHYRQALRLQPSNAEAHANLGVALAELGKHWEPVLARMVEALCRSHESGIRSQSL